jgi:hypothetical protein
MAGLRQHIDSSFCIPRGSWPNFFVWRLWEPSDHSLCPQQQLKVKVTLRLAVCRQLVRLDSKPLETHDQRFFQLNPCGHSPYVTTSLTRRFMKTFRFLLSLKKRRAFVICQHFHSILVLDLLHGRIIQQWLPSDLNQWLFSRCSSGGSVRLIIYSSQKNVHTF